MSDAIYEIVPSSEKHPRKSNDPSRSCFGMGWAFDMAIDIVKEKRFPHTIWVLVPGRSWSKCGTVEYIPQTRSEVRAENKLKKRCIGKHQKMVCKDYYFRGVTGLEYCNICEQYICVVCGEITYRKMHCSDKCRKLYNSRSKLAYHLLRSFTPDGVIVRELPDEIWDIGYLLLDIDRLVKERSGA